MPYVIGMNCITVKDTACVDVCPVDCIHPKPGTADFDSAEQLYIDPDVCIDCGVCEPECPVNAIYAEDSLPGEELAFREKNADWFRLSAAEFEASYGSPGRTDRSAESR